MVEIKRPIIFPECKQCPVAGRRIMHLSKLDNIHFIDVHCSVTEILFWKKVRMTSGGWGSDLDSSDTVKKVYSIEAVEDVTNACPGITKSQQK